MADKINNNTVPDGTINGISESSFDKLNDDQKQIVLTGKNNVVNKEKDAGRMGKFFGANTKNASIHITLLICGILLVLCIIDLFHSYKPDQELTSEVWNLIFPVITLALGYIFGKGED